MLVHFVIKGLRFKKKKLYSTAVQDLPLELIIRINTYLDVTSFHRLAATCKSFHHGMGIYDGRRYHDLTDEVRWYFEITNPKIDRILANIVRKGFLRETKIPFWKALDKNHFELATTVIERGYERDLEYCLFQACVFNQPKLVQLLLEKGADINHVDENQDSCLALSVAAGHVAVVELLLTKSASINHRNAFTNTPLITASFQNNLQIVRLLVDNGADVNLHNLDTLETALLISARQGHPEILKILLDAGADTQTGEEADFSALYLAIERCQTECAHLLIEYGANVHIIDRYLVNLR